jgi:hypothetical protein
MFKNHGDATHLGFQAARTFPLIPHPQAFCPLLRTTLLPPTPLSTNQGHETARKQLVELRLAHSAGPLSTFTCQRDTKTVSRTYISCRPGLLWTRIPSPFFISLVPRVTTLVEQFQRPHHPTSTCTAVSQLLRVRTVCPPKTLQFKKQLLGTVHRSDCATRRAHTLYNHHNVHHRSSHLRLPRRPPGDCEPAFTLPKLSPRPALLQECRLPTQYAVRPVWPCDCPRLRRPGLVSVTLSQCLPANSYLFSSHLNSHLPLWRRLRPIISQLRQRQTEKSIRGTENRI